MPPIWIGATWDKSSEENSARPSRPSTGSPRRFEWRPPGCSPANPCAELFSRLTRLQRAERTRVFAEIIVGRYDGAQPGLAFGSEAYFSLNS